MNIAQNYGKMPVLWDSISSSPREIQQWLIVPFVVSESVRWVATVDLKLP